ncbi:hypothetical protein N8Z38_04235 [Amylibacter sp.]|nr:hypothetical protein [Amylibacter sp.]MDC1289229.1 hypothetical protein [Amylibacter sp.]
MILISTDMMNHVLENLWQDFLVTIFESLSFVENIKYASFDDVVDIIIVFSFMVNMPNVGPVNFDG